MGCGSSKNASLVHDEKNQQKDIKKDVIDPTLVPQQAVAGSNNLISPKKTKDPVASIIVSATELTETPTIEKEQDEAKIESPKSTKSSECSESSKSFKSSCRSSSMVTPKNAQQENAQHSDRPEEEILSLKRIWEESFNELQSVFVLRLACFILH